jgi:hypothetical protein
MSRPDTLNLSEGAHKWLAAHDARQKEQEARAKTAAAPQPEPTRVCSRGHVFTKPDGRRCNVGCCPICTDVNPHYRTETPQESARRICTAPMTPQEQAGKAMIDRPRQPLDGQPPVPKADADWFDAEEANLQTREPGEDDA